MKTVKLSELFDIETGGNMLLQDEAKGEIPVVALGFKNNGIVEYIKENPKHKKYSSGCITVAGWAGGLKAFVQDKNFYVKGRVKILTPKINLTFNEKMYYCLCLNANAYKFAYGRKASSDRLSEILLPNKSEIPDWVYTTEELDLSEYKESFTNSPTPELNTDSWKEFKISDLFNIERGVRLTKADQEPGNIPLVTAGEYNYGINGYISNGKSKLFKNAITVDMFCHAVYRDYEFYCDDNIIVLTPKNEMKLNELLYYSLCICQNKFKFGYGRQLRLSRLDEIKLPVEIPDWVYTTEAPDIEPYREQIDENGKLTVKLDKLCDLIKSGFFNKNESFNNSPTPKLNTDNWQEFKLSDLFKLENGKGYLSNEAQKNLGENPFVCSSESNNGIYCYTSLDNKHKGNRITISSFLNAFYQEKDFSTNKSVIVATPKFKEFNKYIGLFICVILELEKFKYSFGRKATLNKVSESLIIKLPATPEGEPDYGYMEHYIKILPYSKNI